MGTPDIFLHQFRTVASSWRVPGKLAETYAQLETLAYSSFERDKHQSRVHFHLEDGQCEGKILPFLWDSGAYLDTSSVQAAKRHVFAHFEEDGGLLEDAPRRHTAAPVKSEFPHPGHQEFPTSPLAMVDEVGLPVRPPELSMLQTSNGPAVEPRKRSRVEEDMSSNPDEVNSEFTSNDFVLYSEHHDYSYGASGRGRLAPPLPAQVTLANHAIDHARCKGHNAAPDEYGFQSDWNAGSEQRHVEIAHARLIHGIYGMPSPTRCQRCVQEGLACRVYHPALMLSDPCGNCRLEGEPCDMGGLHHRPQPKSAKRQRRPGFSAPNISNRRSISISPANSAMYFCSFKGCPRGGDGFPNKTNFDRHVRVMHPGVTVIAQRTPVVDAALVCPVADCVFRAVTYFPRRGVLDAHIRDCHPKHMQGRDNATECPDHESSTGEVFRLEILQTRVSNIFNPDIAIESYECPLSGCNAMPFGNRSCLKAHISAHHPELILVASDHQTSLDSDSREDMQKRLDWCLKQLHPPCPFSDCTGRSSSGFSAPRKLVSHIRSLHPAHISLLENYRENGKPMTSGLDATYARDASQSLAEGILLDEPALRRHFDEDGHINCFQDELPNSVPVQATVVHRNGRKEYGCPIVDCDQTRSYFPFSNLKQHMTFKHPGVIVVTPIISESVQTTLPADSGAICLVADGEDEGFSDSLDSNQYAQSNNSAFVVQSDVAPKNGEKIATEVSTSSNTQEDDSRTAATKATFSCPVEHCTEVAMSYDQFHTHLWLVHPQLRLSEVLRAIPDSVIMASYLAQPDALDAVVQPLAITRNMRTQPRLAPSQDSEDDEDGTTSSICVIDLESFSSTDDDSSAHDSEETGSFRPIPQSPESSDEYASDESGHDEDDTDEEQPRARRTSLPHGTRHNLSTPRKDNLSSNRVPNRQESTPEMPRAKCSAPPVSSNSKLDPLPPPYRMQPQPHNERRIEPKSITRIRSNMTPQHNIPNRFSSPNVRSSPFKDRSLIADMLLGTPIRGQTPNETSQSATPSENYRCRPSENSPYGQNRSSSRTFEELSSNRGLTRSQTNNNGAMTGAQAGRMLKGTKAGSSDVGNLEAVSEEAILQAEISQQYDSDGSTLFV